MRKKQKHYLSIIIILILCITIGYAYLSSTLNGEITTVNIYPVTRKCQRAKTLHSITCTSSSTEGYCKAGKRKDSITFGQIGTSGKLASGDAFDCDVKGTGTTNRFYYLTDLDSTTAILLSSTFSYKHFSTLYNLAGSAPCGARPVIEVLKNDMDY